MNIDKVLFRRLKRYIKNQKTRTHLKRRLRGMPMRELDRLAWDIGTTRAELLREAHSPFWKTTAEPRDEARRCNYSRQNGLCASSSRLP